MNHELTPGQPIKDRYGKTGTFEMYRTTPDGIKMARVKFGNLIHEFPESTYNTRFFPFTPDLLIQNNEDIPKLLLYVEKYKKDSLEALRSIYTGTKFKELATKITSQSFLYRIDHRHPSNYSLKKERIPEFGPFQQGFSLKDEVADFNDGLYLSTSLQLTLDSYKMRKNRPEIFFYFINSDFLLRESEKIIYLEDDDTKIKTKQVPSEAVQYAINFNKDKRNIRVYKRTNSYSATRPEH